MAVGGGSVIDRNKKHRGSDFDDGGCMGFLEEKADYPVPPDSRRPDACRYRIRMDSVVHQ